VVGFGDVMPDTFNDRAPGDVVSVLEPSELVEIQRLAPFGSKTRVEGVGLQARRAFPGMKSGRWTPTTCRWMR
jgi:hypothetical protein